MNAFDSSGRPQYSRAFRRTGGIDDVSSLHRRICPAIPGGPGRRGAASEPEQLDSLRSVGRAGREVHADLRYQLVAWPPILQHVAVFPGFNEAQFEFLVTHELSNLWQRHLIEPPHMTTNRQEARLGYDVGLTRRGRVLLVQFKLSEHLVGANSTECRKGFNRRPYYRIRITNEASSYQYDTLCQTVRQTISRTGNAVAAAYIAPKFMDGAQKQVPRSQVRAHSRAWLGRHFKNATLLQHLLVQDVLRLRGIARGQNHALAICVASGLRKVFSEPVLLDEPYDFGEFIPEGFARARGLDDAVELRELLETLLGAARELRPRRSMVPRLSGARHLSDGELLRAVRNLMARRHNAQLFVLSTTPLY